MTARFTLGLMMLVLQLTLFATGSSSHKLLILISLGYFASTLTSGLFGKPRFLGSTFNRSWLRLVGIDVLAFLSMQLLQNGNINYMPLFALPILLASVLGSLQLALGTAAGITVLVLSGTLWTHWGDDLSSATTHLVQAALSGVGYFVIALLANQLSTRLAQEGLRARRSQAAANIQQQVNALVIKSFSDGVLIVDANNTVHTANPAARRLLGPYTTLNQPSFRITDEASWAPLHALTRQTFASGQSQTQEVTLRHEALGPQRMRVKTHLTSPQEVKTDSLCVLFLQDQRELEARMRTEKIASMGRMSTAVAHEIRNPLATITQANALLEEELTDPKHQQLTRMVGQNAQRLSKIVNDILSTTYIEPPHNPTNGSTLALNESVLYFCQDWATHNACQDRLLLQLAQQRLQVCFENDHLQRILVNLLDNAKRYANTQPESIQVRSQSLNTQQAVLSVWSNGAPMDQSVERHLFEPFFSSESRSSGLGLYLCRELCKGHGASIQFQRNARKVQGQWHEGNEFTITLLCAATTSPPIAPYASRPNASL